jgi:hypothetical protein
MVFPVSQDSTFKDDVTALQGAMSRQGDYMRLNILLNIIQYIFNTLKRFPNLSPVQWSKRRKKADKNFLIAVFAYWMETFLLANAHMQIADSTPKNITTKFDDKTGRT